MAHGLWSGSWLGTRAARRAQAVAAALALTVAGLAVNMSADAAGTPEGPATVRSAGGTGTLTTGDSATAFTLGLPAAAACPGDSANGGYRWQTYMVLAAIDPATLTFGANGPLPPGTDAEFRQPLYGSPGGSPVVNQQTAAADTPNGPGRILNVPDMNYAVFPPGTLDRGTYNVGIACTLGPAGPDQMKNFWNVQKTFTPGGGPAEVGWTLTTLSTITTVPATTVPTSTTTTAAASTTSTSTPTTSTSLGTTTTVATTTSSALATTTSTAVSSTTTSTAPTSTTTSTLGPTTPATVAPTTIIVSRPFAVVCDVLQRVLGRFPLLRGLFEALSGLFGC